METFANPLPGPYNETSLSHPTYTPHLEQQLLPSPHDLSSSLPSDGPFGSQPGAAISSLPSTLSPLFVDKIAQKNRLDDLQTKELQFVLMLGSKLGQGLLPEDLATRIHILASVFSSENRILQYLRNQDGSSTGHGINIPSLFKDISIRLEDTFHFTKEQKTNIRRVAQDLIYQANRIKFKDLHIDIEKKMRKEPDSYRMGNVFGQPAREAQFMTLAKRVASNVRNTFRQDLRNSILPGPAQTSLTVFTVQMAMKYRLGSITSHLEQGYKIHNALLRRFAYENKSLLCNVDEDEDEDEDPSESDVSPPRKRKRTAKAGRIPKGDDFWSRVDSWFADGVALRERDLLGHLWRTYVDETIKRDNNRFDTDPDLTSLPSSLTPMVDPPSTTVTAGPLSSVFNSGPSPAPVGGEWDAFFRH